MNASSVVNFCKNYVLCINVIKEYWAWKSIKKQIVFYFSWEECLYFISGINARSQIIFSSVVCYKRNFWKQVTSCGMRLIWQQFPKLMPRSGHVWQTMSMTDAWEGLENRTLKHSTDWNVSVVHQLISLKLIPLLCFEEFS